MALGKTISFYTLGCKLNFAESASIGRNAHGSGFEVLAPESRADFAVINTCSVTENADRKCRRMVRDILAENPSTRVIIIGCYAQLKPQEIAEIPGVALVLGAAEKFNLALHLNSLAGEPQTGSARVLAGKTDLDLPFHTSWSSSERTRSFLKVQDGCDYSCTFCTIPLARGQSRNANISQVVAEASKIAALGIKEIVLTGVNTGDFGKSSDESFLDLIRELDQLQSVSRFRISSIEPNLLSEEIISFVARSQRFVPHFHIPLQSGNDRILAAMRRRYRRALFASRIQAIKSLMPWACIGVDVIVGFPGETEADFMDTFEFLKELDISYLHVFSYSRRENTLAFSMENQITGDVKSRRSAMLHALSEKKRTAFYMSQLGSVREVMFEQENQDGYIHGFSDNYVKVAVLFHPSLVRSLALCRLEKPGPGGAVLAGLSQDHSTHNQQPIASPHILSLLSD